MKRELLEGELSERSRKGFPRGTPARKRRLNGERALPSRVSFGLCCSLGIHKKRGCMYLMDDPREAERLAAKVDPERWVETYLRRHLFSSCSVLDVGCGPGVIARAIGKLFPTTTVVGVDASAERISEARRLVGDCLNVEMSEGRASCLPFESHQFDLVYCRFLLEYLPDRKDAISEMVRVCAPGGRVLLQDLDGQLVWHYPCDEGLQGDIGRVLRRLGMAGFDPFVGRKLFSFARSAGLCDIEVRAESYHLVAGRIDELNYHLWQLKLDIALPAMAKALNSRIEAEALRDAFLAYLRRDDTLTYSVVFTVVGTKPGEEGGVDAYP